MLLWVSDLTCRFVHAIQRPYDHNCTHYKTAWFAPERKVYMGSSPNLVIFPLQNSDVRTRLTSLYGSKTSSVVLDANQRRLDRDNKSLWVPDLTCRSVQAKPCDLHQNDKSVWVPALICVFFLCAKQWLLDQTYKSVLVPHLNCGFEHT